MGGLFGSIKIPGNRLTDLVGQTSTVGKPIPFGYGKCNITEPNVIWTAGIPKEHVRRKKQGKGGVKTEEFTYTLSYAIAFMAGPTYGYLTIKRGSKVVYTTDPNSPIEDREFAAKWAQKARFYHGTEDQLPDPTIESYKGAGQVSAHRGLSYIVVTDDDVTAEGGSVPQYEAVIIASPPEFFVTSTPYKHHILDAIGTAPTAGPAKFFGIEFDSIGAEPAAISSLGPRATVQYLNYSDDVNNRNIDASTVEPTALDGKVTSVRVAYSIPPTDFTTCLPTARDGGIKRTLQTYSDAVPDKITAIPSALNGTFA